MWWYSLIDMDKYVILRTNVFKINLLKGSWVDVL